MTNHQKPTNTQSPTPSTPQLTRIETAVAELLDALGIEQKGDLEKTPKRVAQLWTQHLLAGHQLDSNQILAQAVTLSEATTPVCVTNLGTYMVCPHHLTVASGTTHIVYEPNGKLTGFGTLADLVHCATAQITFQESATEHIAEVITNHLAPKAVVVMMSATHPCQTLNHPRAHASEVITWAQRGTKPQITTLMNLLQFTLKNTDGE